jgi:hypothetical protein
MNIGYLSFAVLPMLILTIAVVAIYLHYKRKVESDYDVEMKQLRQFLFSGKLDKNKFNLVKNRLKIDSLLSEQGDILENMFQEEKIDSITYVRMKNALKLSMNQKLKKIKCRHLTCNFLNILMN